MKKPIVFIIPLLLVLGGVYYFKFYQPGSTTTDLRISGNIEVTEAQMSFKIPGRLASRQVGEGDQVERGQVLARLDSTDQQIALAQAEANLGYAQAVLAELIAGSRSQEIETARAELTKAAAAEKTAQVQLQQAEADHRRYQALYAEGGISKRQYESYANAYAAAQNFREEAAARIRSAAEQLDLRETGPRPESIDQARAKVRVAEEGVKQARQQLSYTEIAAPFAGVVLSTSAEAGEYLNPATPVLTLGEVSAPWLRAYVNETDLGRIALKQPVQVTTDSYPGKQYPGQISFISSQAEFTPKSVQTFEERVKLMYRVKIQLANPDHELKPGMPADAVLVPKQ